MKILTTLLILLSITFGYSQNDCPNLSNGNNNPNFDETVYVFDDNFELIDTVECTVAGGSNNFNCNDIDTNHFYVYVTEEGDTCFYDSEGNSIDNPLPIELKEFNVVKEDGVNVVTWATYSERNNDYFTIEHSLDGYIWSTITTINGGGTSTTPLDYVYNHYGYSIDTINYYRLKQTDYDGKYEIFDIVAVDNRNSKKKLLKIVNLMGKEVKSDEKGLVIEIFSDGTTRKVYKTERKTHRSLACGM